MKTKISACAPVYDISITSIVTDKLLDSLLYGG